MATSYPAGLDNFTNPTNDDTLESANHVGQHTNLNDAVEAIEATLGTNPQGGSATVKARIAALESGGGSGSVTLTSYQVNPNTAVNSGEEILVPVTLASGYLTRVDVHALVYFDWGTSTVPAKAQLTFSAASATFSDVNGTVEGMAFADFAAANRSVALDTMFTSGAMSLQVISGNADGYAEFRADAWIRATAAGTWNVRLKNTGPAGTALYFTSWAVHSMTAPQGTMTAIPPTTS